MFVRFKTADSEVNLIAANIIGFVPSTTLEGGSDITLIGGAKITVPQSNQSVRGALKKLAAPVTAVASED